MDCVLVGVRVADLGSEVHQQHAEFTPTGSRPRRCVCSSGLRRTKCVISFIFVRANNIVKLYGNERANEWHIFHTTVIWASREDHRICHQGTHSLPPMFLPALEVAQAGGQDDEYY